MAPPRTGPCADWTTVEDVEACCAAAVGLDPDVAADNVAQASAILWEATGRRFGICETTVAPVMPEGGCRTAPWCGLYEALDMADFAPIVDVVDVAVGGVALDASAWRVDEWRWIVRTDGGRWPWCNSLRADVETSIRVQFEYGIPVPSYLAAAAKLLACELAKLCGGGPCDLLADRATTVVREGVTYAILEPYARLVDDGGGWSGLIGIPSIDRAILAANGAGAGVARPVTGMFDPAAPQSIHVGTTTAVPEVIEPPVIEVV